MADAALYVLECSAGVSLVPKPIQALRCVAELDDKIAGEVLRFRLAPLLPPEPHQGRLVTTHDDPCVRAADKRAPFRKPMKSRRDCCHCFLLQSKRRPAAEPH